MKLIAIILVSALQTGVIGYAQKEKITLSVKNAPLADVFTEIEKQTDYHFAYSPEDLRNAKTVTFSVRNATLEAVLSICFKDQPITYQIVDNQSISIRCLHKALAERAPPPKPLPVTGTVKGINGELMPGVTVSSLSSYNSTITNDKGEFEIYIEDNSATLKFSYVNYDPQTVPVNRGKHVTVQLNMAAKGLDEVIVIPYSYTTPRLTTGSVFKVTAVDIAKQPVNDPLAALVGSVPGLLVTQNIGLPGSRFSVQIRGQNSIGLTQNNLPPGDPFFLVNGVPFAPNNQFQSLVATNIAHGPRGRSPFSIINPDDIESIEILKDADATSIYGSRAANGAVIITTKKGKIGKPAFSLNARTGSGWVTRQPPLLNTKQYVALRRESLTNDNVPVNSMLAPDLVSWDTTRYTDFQDMLIGGASNTTTLQASVTGGTDNTQYLFSANHHYETTVFPGKLAYNRTSMHGQVSHHSRDQKLNINVAALLSYDKDNAAGWDLTNYANAAPNLPALYKSDGSLNWESNGAVFDNPMAYLLQKDIAKTGNVLLSLQANYRLTNNFTLKFSGGYSGVRADEARTQPGRSQNPVYIPNAQSISYFGTGIYKGYIAEPQLEYTSPLWKGNLTVLVGSTWQSLNNTFESTKGSGFSSDDQLDNKSSAGSLTLIKEENDKYKYYGLFGRISYNLDNRYLINLNARRDGSSRFGPSKQFGNFGSIGAAWIFSGTNFIRQHAGWLSFGKLRGSYGTTGNDQIGEYKFLSYWSGTQYSYLGSNGLIPIQPASPNYSWEECSKMEAALDLGFMKDRLTFSVAWYLNRNGNQLLSYALPATTGFSNFAAKNFDAMVENSGFEITAQARSNGKGKFNWTSRLILTIPRNKLVSFPSLLTTRYPGFIIGQSLTAQNTLHYTGVDPTTGLFQFEDVNKDGKISFPEDYKLSQNLDPKVYGGLENSFTLQHWQMDISIQGRIQKGDSYLYSIYKYAPPGSTIVNQPAAVLNRWQYPGNNAPMQRASAGADQQASTAWANFLLSDGKFTDVSYLRLRNVSIRYLFNEKQLGALGLKQASIYLQGQNLLTITGYEGYNPETQANWSLPPLKTIVLGIEVGF